MVKDAWQSYLWRTLDSLTAWLRYVLFLVLLKNVSPGADINDLNEFNKTALPTKELDQFLKVARANLRLPFVVPEEQKNNLVLKYLGEADKSPFFWVNLAETFGTAKKNLPLMSSPDPEAAAAALVIHISYENVMSSKWGSLALSSEPSGAEVWLKRSSGRTKEGHTRINRRYPEGPYTFVVELQGYKNKEVPVNIDRNKPVEEKVTLEKQ